MNIEYRIPTSSDIVSIKKINENSLQENYGLSEWEMVMDHFSSLCRVATHDKLVIGYCIIVPIQTQTQTQKGHQIPSFAIDSKYRNQGIGTTLLGKSISNLNYVELHCRENNVVALKLYYKLGFEKKTIQENYYKNPTDNAFILVKHQQL